jgi:hypothetical protein
MDVGNLKRSRPLELSQSSSGAIQYGLLCFTQFGLRSAHERASSGPAVSLTPMAAPTESGRSRTLDKEAISNFPNFRGDDCEKTQHANTEVLRRATLKIDLYLIPILSMFCVSSHSPQLSLLTSHIPSVLLSFVVSA